MGPAAEQLMTIHDGVLANLVTGHRSAVDRQRRRSQQKHSEAEE